MHSIVFFTTIMKSFCLLRMMSEAVISSSDWSEWSEAWLWYDWAYSFALLGLKKDLNLFHLVLEGRGFCESAMDFLTSISWAMLS